MPLQRSKSRRNGQKLRLNVAVVYVAMQVAETGAGPAQTLTQTLTLTLTLALTLTLILILTPPANDAVQPNMLLNLPPGAVFVHRNIGNLFGLKDLSGMAVVEYAVSHLKVRQTMGHHPN